MTRRGLVRVPGVSTRMMTRRFRNGLALARFVSTRALAREWRAGIRQNAVWPMHSHWVTQPDRKADSYCEDGGLLDY